MENIQKNLRSIQQRINKAAERSGHDPGSIRLVAVSKRHDSEAVQRALEAGQLVFGENYLQEAREKIEKIGPEPGLKWHFIGHLQSNKAKQAALLFDMIETVDRLKLAKALDRYAGEAGRKLSILVQINIGGEEQKAGVSPQEAEQLISNISEYPNLRIQGLMTMPPWRSDPEEVRPWFRKLRLMAEDFRSKGCLAEKDKLELSMGMSHDFETAIEEGATLVRVGTAIFGPRP
ncbi:MAG: YggS family pyridoxal phosphate-dependent enzyme [Thermodesulfobacteriota bacterium]